MAAMAKGRSCLFGVLDSDDSRYCLDILKKLGVSINKIDDTAIELVSPGIHELHTEEVLYIGSAGTTARFLPGLLSASDSKIKYMLDASEQLKKRPMRTLLDKLEVLGADITYHEQPYHLPLTILGSRIQGGEIEMPGNISSQFISGMLMAAPYFTDGLKIKMTTPIVQSQYVQITIEMMRAFGVNVVVNQNYTEFCVSPQQYTPQVYSIEPDVSTAGYFFALGLLFDTEVHIDINSKTSQPDIELLDILEKMGATVIWNDNHVVVKNQGIIKGNQSFDLNSCSDQALTVGAISAFADGPVYLYGIEHIRHHESDRLQVLHENLKRLGIHSKLETAGITIYPGVIKRHVELPTYDDHRVAMAFSLIALKEGDIIIQDASCTKKTFPQFFQYLQTLGANISLYEENTL